MRCPNTEAALTGKSITNPSTFSSALAVLQQVLSRLQAAQSAKFIHVLCRRPFRIRDPVASRTAPLSLPLSSTRHLSISLSL
jgi:hypothetical protein